MYNVKVIKRVSRLIKYSDKAESRLKKYQNYDIDCRTFKSELHQSAYLSNASLPSPYKNHNLNLSRYVVLKK